MVAALRAFRNKLPLIDHNLIADAEASDLAGSYSFSNLTRFLTRIVQLSHGESARSGPRRCSSRSPHLHCSENT